MAAETIHFLEAVALEQAGVGDARTRADGDGGYIAADLSAETNQPVSFATCRYQESNERRLSGRRS